MKWFKHDSSAHIDTRIKKVKHKYGIVGYGLYWYCIELIAMSVDGKNISFELEDDAEVIALEWSLDQLKVQEIMMYMVDIGLFESSDGRITCLKLAKRLDDTNSKNPEIRKMLASINSKSLGHTPNNSEQLRTEEIRLDKNRLELKPLVDKEKNLPTPYVKIKDSYNELIGDDFPKCQALSTKRKTVLKKFWTILGKDLEKVESYFSFFAKHATPHQRGANGWTADIEFICREETVVKMREIRT
tara:strand:- start:9539 stop:10270 length:732 start_codon:yes stop_codon:yes gene_type:complete